MIKEKQKPIEVFSEIGQLIEVVVHCPGKELENFNIAERGKYLMDGDLDWVEASKEHKLFTDILKKHGVKVIEFADLFCQAWKIAKDEDKEKFVNTFITEAGICDLNIEKKLRLLYLQLTDKKIASTLICGVTRRNLLLTDKRDEFIIPPLNNIYFQRDNFCSIGECISINKMKYIIRQRETLLSEFVFNTLPKYKNVKKVYSRYQGNTIEGGDIFPYTKDTLVVGISERTTLKAITKLAANLKRAKTQFKQIVCINVPKVGRLMHLDTWLTMLDKNKFLYSPNAVKDFKFWKIDLTKEIVATPLKVKNLKECLKYIIGKEPILIPVAGNSSPMQVDRETKYDGTNYLVIKPGVVVGYSRNRLTNKALTDAGIIVHEFDGDELSLGEGNARCMSMPLIRKAVK